MKPRLNVEETNLERSHRLRKLNSSIAAEFYRLEANNLLRQIIIDNTNLIYFVSNVGDVYTMSIYGMIKKPKLQLNKKTGYYFINILDNSSRKNNGTLKNRTMLVHRLVAYAWHCDGQYRDRSLSFDMVINHKDKNRLNNDYNNLELIPQFENILHGSNIKYSYVNKVGNRFSVVFKQKYFGTFATAEIASKALKKYLIENNIVIPKYAKFAE